MSFETTLATSTTSRRRSPGHLVIGLVVLLTGCATAEPPPGAPRADQPRHAVGSEWAFQTRHSGSWAGPRQVNDPRFTFQGERVWQGRKLLSYGTFHLDDRMRFVVRVRDGKVIESWDPHYAPINFPLFVGKSWSTNFAYKNAETGTSYPNVYFPFAVRAYEKITVPAGTFDAFRVSGGEPGVEWTYWYAPEVQFFIKVKVERNRQSPSGPGALEWELARYALK